MFLYCILCIWSLYAYVKIAIGQEKEIHKIEYGKEQANILRGICAIGITFVHIPLYIQNTHFFLFQESQEWGTLLVGFFFFLTGYGLMSSYLQKKESYLRTFLRKRFLAILPSAIIAILLCQILRVIENRFVWREVLSHFFKGEFFFPAQWFVQAIIYYYIAFYLSFRFIKRDRNKLIVFMLATVLWISITFIFNWASFIRSSVLAVNIGMFFKYYEEQISRSVMRNKKIIYLVILLALGLHILLYFSGHKVYYTLSNLYIQPCIVLLVWITGVRQWSILSFMGTVSYEIYLTHFIVLDQISFFSMEGNAAVIISLFFTIGASWILHHLSLRIHKILIKT